MSGQRVYTMLDLRLGLVELTPEQQQRIDRVIPILAQAGRRELRRLTTAEPKSKVSGD